jgi:hypothetical protein
VKEECLVAVSLKYTLCLILRVGIYPTSVVEGVGWSIYKCASLFFFFKKKKEKKKRKDVK